MKPEFIDNRGSNTMAAALKGHLEWLERTRRDRIELSIATGYFDIRGFAQVADQVERLQRVRLLLGAEPLVPPATPIFKPGQPRGEEYEREAISKALQAYSLGLESDRNLLSFSREVDRSVERLLEFLRSGKLEVRRYERGFLHGKAYIFSTDEGAIAGSSNFTGAGLTSNLELNLGRYDPSPVSLVRTWFDDLWKESVPYDLENIYSARYAEYEPYLLFLRVLWEMYSQELKQEAHEGPIRLTTFQKDGLFRARRILDQFNGVIFADGVGLGKTFVGGALLLEVLKERRQRALLIAPATLRDGLWQRFSEVYQIYIERLSFEELAADPALGGTGTRKLAETPDKYSLIVVDEAHAFRNPETQRARALRRLLEGDPPKKVVLMSATPVNNSLWDLYYLLNFFIRNDAAFADRGILSLKARFGRAMAEDPFELRPDVLFDILDTTTVRRTRHFIRKYYPGDRVVGPDGVEVPILFPEPVVKAVRYPLTDELARLIDAFAGAMAPVSGVPKLQLARYSPSHYLSKSKAGRDRAKDQREAALVGLLRSGLLKRLESSAYAFSRTLERMIQSHEAFLRGLALGYVAAPSAIEEWEETDSDEAFMESLESASSQPATLYDCPRLRRAVEADRKVLLSLKHLADKVPFETDPKLEKLEERLVEIAHQANKEGQTADEVRDKLKVIVFTYFADSLSRIERFLKEAFVRNHELHYYRDRMVSVVGEESRGGITREDAIFGFAPKTSDPPSGKATDRFDILITTDVLAEGQNLQQCRNIVNFDLPWNPMRLVQRHGRVDRIGSIHERVYLWCFFPVKELDTLLRLEERIRTKLAQAAASVGVEEQVIPRSATREVVFGETRKEIEAILHEDPTLFVNAGEDPNAHSGEEYRQELRKGLEHYGDRISRLPWAAGSGFSRGVEDGYFFCARVGDRSFLRFVRPKGGEPVRDTLECLRRITCPAGTPRVLASELLPGVYDAWLVAQRDIFEEWSAAVDPKKLHPKVRPLFRRIGEHLRQHPPPGLPQEEVDRVIDSVEAPWGARIEKQLRSVFEVEVAPRERSRLLAEKVKDLGLQPFRAPTPLPQIQPEDVSLVCWLVTKGPVSKAPRPEAVRTLRRVSSRSQGKPR